MKIKVILILLLVLMMCGVSWGVVEPIYEYITTDNVFNTQSSAACSQPSLILPDNGITDVAAYYNRTAKVTSSSIVDPIIGGTEATPIFLSVIFNFSALVLDFLSPHVIGGDPASSIGLLPSVLYPSSSIFPRSSSAFCLLCSSWLKKSCYPI